MNCMSHCGWNKILPTWYLGHCILRNPDGTVKIEHLHCTN